MLLRGLALATALLVSGPAPSADVPQADPIPKVVCPKLKGQVSGTAFRIGPKLLVTAKHVSDEEPCEIEGRAMHTIYADPKQDFAELWDDSAGQFLKVDCGGFVEGREYLALGHARGVDEVIAVPMVATGRMHNSGMAMLWGIMTTIPGMSGGPILDKETGKAVGIVNASNFERGLSFSVQFKDTPLCKGNGA